MACYDLWQQPKSYDSTDSSKQERSERLQIKHHEFLYSKPLPSKADFRWET
jgi:hypothetical protein